jgi:hypothetical protein
LWEFPRAVFVGQPTHTLQEVMQKVSAAIISINEHIWLKYGTITTDILVADDAHVYYVYPPFNSTKTAVFSHIKHNYI